MLTILIGHRGVGKTHLLKQFKNYFKKNKKSGLFFDLDLEIERASQKTILELFQKGEAHFRQWERRVFKKIINEVTNSVKKEQPCFLSVGAGFVFQKKADWNVIYLFKESDKQGRIFPHRPSLTNLSGLKEWKKLYKKRSKYYLSQANRCFYKREYFKDIEDSDLIFLGLKELNKPIFCYRLYPKLLPTTQKDLKKFLKERLNWGVRFFELNDTDCSLKFIQTVQKLLPPDKLLYSSQKSKKLLSIKNKKHWSWELNLGKIPEEVSILSVHNRNSQPLSQLLKELSGYRLTKQLHIKLAVEIYNLKELKLAYNWWKEDPQNRSFLPRSSNGKWLWFRQVFGPLMRLHFIKEHPLAFTKYEDQEVLDQPYLSEALSHLKLSHLNLSNLNFATQEDSFNQTGQTKDIQERDNRQAKCMVSYKEDKLEFIKLEKTQKNLDKINVKKPLKLAGIIANPVKNLATPGEQSPFFYKKHSMTVLTLNLEEKELSPSNLKILREFGFLFFAVSSPHKKRAYLSADQSDTLSKKFQSSNTLLFQNQKWKSFNTDWEGLKNLKKYNKPSTVVWGGGGTRLVLQELLPKAQFYSARKGKKLNSMTHPSQLLNSARKTEFFKLQKNSVFPLTVIWAVGRKRMKEGCLWPPKVWQPSQVIDINYTEDSPGLEYALRVKAKYKNGWSFFKKQAKKQRELFQKANQKLK